MQDCASDNKIKENKYKILRMSLLLGSDENREETLNNFEDAAREIDAMNDAIYLKGLEDKFYDTLKIEEEEKKLDVLVNYIGGRVEQRISLLTDFANVTGFDLQNLPPIKYYDRLDDYKERLFYIREYLDNISRLETLNKEVNDASEKLEVAYKNKAASEEFNQRNEEILLNKFMHIVSSLDYFKDINEDNVSERLNDVESVVRESKKSLDIFTKSFTTLVHSGIGFEQEQEYRSYVTDAQDIYYSNKEKEYFIRLYQYLLQKECEYNPILVKRDCINDLLYERLNLRQELEVNDNDLLAGFYDLLERQYQDIQKQKDNIENIGQLNDTIQSKKEEINELELDNQKVEILALLREFCIIDTSYSDEVESSSSVEEVGSAASESSNDGIFDAQDANASDGDDVPESVDNDVNSNDDIFSVKTDIKEEENKTSVDLFSLPEQVKEEVSNDIKQENEVSNDIKQENEVVEKEEEKPLDNQVVLVENSIGIDLDLVHSKANKVMQRVGEMLGIKPKEEVVVSVTSDNNESNVLNQSSSDSAPKESESIPQNPLFNSEIDLTNNHSENVEKVPEDNSTIDNDFWFPSDTPDALNELPDLETSTEVDNNNFFSNNSMSDLNFPDLKVDFGSNEEA